MGVTQISWDRLHHFIGMEGLSWKGLKMLELGSQNMYTNALNGQMRFAKESLEALGVEHTSVDVNEEGGSLVMDLSVDQTENFSDWMGKFDVVTDYGTSEHVRGLYQCLRNVRFFCRPGGLMIHENPKTGNWPGHGFHYRTEEFWRQVAYMNRDTVVDVGEHPAMGNTTDGWNIHCVLRRGDTPGFVPEKDFKQTDLHTS